MATINQFTYKRAIAVVLIIVFQCFASTAYAEKSLLDQYEDFKKIAFPEITELLINKELCNTIKRLQKKVYRIF